MQACDSTYSRNYYIYQHNTYFAMHACRLKNRYTDVNYIY